MKKRFLLKITSYILAVAVFSQNVYAFTPFIKPYDIYDVNKDGEITASDAASILNYVLFGTSHLSTEGQREVTALTGMAEDTHMTANNASRALRNSIDKESVYSKTSFNFSTLDKGIYRSDYEINGYLTLMGNESNPLEVAERDQKDEFFESYPVRARLLGGGEVESNYIKITLDKPSAIRILASPAKLVSTMGIFNTLDEYGRILYLCNENYEIIESYNRWYESNTMGIKTSHLYTDNILDAGTYYLAASTEHGIDIEEIVIYEF